MERLAKFFGSKSSVHRWSLVGLKMASLKKILRALGRFIEKQGRFRIYECFVDETFSRAKGGGDGIGCIKAGKGVKILILWTPRDSGWP